MPRPLLPLLVLCLLPALSCGEKWSAVFREGPATLGADLELVQGAPYPSFSGALLGEIEEGGPAGLAGLQPGDLVEYFYGEKVNGPCDLDRQILALEPGQEVTVFLQRGGGVSTHTVELADALDLYEEGCDDGRAASCYRLGLLYAKGKGSVAADPVRSRELFERACDLGDPPACTKTGLLHEYGQDIRKDPEKARAFYKRACDGTDCRAGDPAGCFHLGLFLRNGSGGERDEAKAAELFRRACNSGHEEACQDAAALHAFPPAAAPRAPQ